MSEGVFDPEVYGEPIYSDVQFDTEVYGELGADSVGTGNGQAQADILHTYQGYGQAQAFISKSKGLGQAQAKILVPGTVIRTNLTTSTGNNNDGPSFGWTATTDRILILMASNTDGFSPTSTPSGYTLLWKVERGGESSNTLVYAKVADGTETNATGFVWSEQGPAYHSYVIIEYSGAVWPPAYSSGVTPPAVTIPSDTPGVIVTFYANAPETATGTPGTGWAELADFLTNGTYPQIYVEDKFFTTGTGSVTPTATFTSGFTYPIGGTVALSGSAVRFSVFAQAQAQIKVAGINVFGQAQAGIKQIYQGYAQCQADIKQTYQGYAQCQALITHTIIVCGQAQATILAISTTASTVMVFDPEVYGEPVYTDNQSDTEVYGELGADVAVSGTTNAFGQAQADILHTYQGYAQCQADIKHTYQSYGQCQAQIINTYQAYGQAQAFIIPTRVFGQCQADILAVSYGFGQCQADIRQTYQGYGQCQANVVVTQQQYGQCQADIKVTSRGFGQCQAQIKQTYNGFAQCQAKVLQTYNGFGQCQATITPSAFNGTFGQANADIKAKSNKFAQVTASIDSPIKVQWATTQAYINKSAGYGQATALIHRSEAQAQAQAQIKHFRNFVNAQARAVIINKKKHGQAQAQIKRANNRGFGQTQTQITNGGMHGQACALINKSRGQAQAQARIVSFNTYAFAQGQAGIITTVNASAQAQAQIIRKNNPNLAQAQANITTSIIKTFVFGQAISTILLLNRKRGQAQADILVTNNLFAQAQALIMLPQGFGQAQGFTSQPTPYKYAQAQGFISGQFFRTGQARAKIPGVPTRGYSQAMARVKFSRNFASIATNVDNSYQKYIVEQFVSNLATTSAAYYTFKNDITLTGAPYSASNALYKDIVWDHIGNFHLTRTNGSIGNGPYGGQIGIPGTTDASILSKDTVDGLNYLQRATIPALLFANIGYEIWFWFKPLELPTTGGAQLILLVGNTTEIGAGAISFKYEPTGILSVYYGNGSTAVLGLQYTGLQLNEWHYIVYVTQNFSTSKYLVVNANTITADVATTDPANTIFISGDSSTTLKFMIDELSIRGIGAYIGAGGYVEPYLYGLGLRMKLGHAQAFILTGTRQGGQAQASIFIPWRFGQARASIITVPHRVAQAQAYIKGYNTGQAQALITRAKSGLGQAQAMISKKYIQTGLAKASVTSTKPSGQAQGYILSQRYLVSYNDYQLPGYAQEETIDSVMTIKSYGVPYQEMSFTEYLGLENKMASLRLKVVGENYLDCKNQIEMAATIIRSNRSGFAPLYIQYYDRHFEALATSLKLEANTGNIRTADYTIDFECKPWIVSDAETTLSGTTLVETTGRTLYNGGWTPARLVLTGTNITVSGHTATGDFTGFVSISGTVSNYVLDTDVYETSDNSVLLTPDYQLYVGPGVTRFAITGATGCTITYRDRWYL